jgi:hypothetical protein
MNAIKCLKREFLEARISPAVNIVQHLGFSWDGVRKDRYDHSSAQINQFETILSDFSFTPHIAGGGF